MSNKENKIVKLARAGGQGVVDAIFSPSTPIDPERDPGFAPGTRILNRGTVHREGGFALPVDVKEERDVAIPMRDGTVVYADIFRPANDAAAPAILVWGPYGKRNGFLRYDLFPGRMDVDASWEDGLNKFEGPSPSYWVEHGYAVINIDVRGAFRSEGNLHFLGLQEAQDEYDTIEWIAAQAWSNGKVGLAGNSWLAVSQFNVAALNPPHLSAIAPWEGGEDTYRDLVAPGGILSGEFQKFLFFALQGERYTENLLANFQTRPLMDEYWESKLANLEEITVPAYVVASWTNIIHSRGTLNAWRRISSQEKWLRVHNTHEWTDSANPQYVEDLRRFFDCFLKGTENGWKDTPTVRLSVLDPGRVDTVDRAEATFPLSRETHIPLYLDLERGELVQTPRAEAHNLRYIPDENGTTLRLEFSRSGEIAGFGKLRLWVSAEDADDMDVFVYVSILDAFGNERLPEVVSGRFHAGMNGRLRVSLRELDPRSTESQPVHTFRREQKLAPGEIVGIDIDLWPYAIRYHAGESLQLRINGADLLRRPEAPDLPPPETLNTGTHILHAGGEYDSYLLLPFVDGQDLVFGAPTGR